MATEVAAWTSRVMPACDNLVRAMTMSRTIATVSLLEARATTLVVTLAALATAYKAAYRRSSGTQLSSWLPYTIEHMYSHVQIMRTTIATQIMQRESVQVSQFYGPI